MPSPLRPQTRERIIARRLAAALLGLSACGAPPVAQEKAPAATRQGKTAEQTTLDNAQADTPRPKLRPELRQAGEGPVARLVAEELKAAGADQRKLIVYVGAPWCEPCVAFHDALIAGELDAELPATRFLEFNMDLDRERLALAGYTSRLIPLFALPLADGRTGDQRIEGGIKGPGAVANLRDRLRPLLAD